MPTPIQNVLFLFVLPPGTLNAADRLIDALMILIDAVADLALAATRAPTIPGYAAQTLFFRLTSLITTLIRISVVGIRTPREPKPATPARLPPAPAAQLIRSAPTPSLPRSPGWLLATLPDIAPAVAADLGLMLADPAFAALLDAAPNLRRTLRPILRALGLAATPISPPPDAPSPDAPPPDPPSPSRPSPSPPRRIRPTAVPPRNAMPPHRNRPFLPTPRYALIVTTT